MLVTEAATGEHGLELMNESFDLVLVDVGLPGIDGFTVVRAIRERHLTPIVMLTAAADEPDRVLGLELGADDYVVKPFLTREFVARVHALLRRSVRGEAVDSGKITFGRIVIDPLAQEVVRDGNALHLTGKEYELLWFLATSPRQLFSREQLLRTVWKAEPDWQGLATVTQHVHRLRRLVEIDSSHPRHITTVRGSGYRFDP